MEVPEADLLLREPEVADVGALASRSDAPSDCGVVRSLAHLCAGDPRAPWGDRPPDRRRVASALTLGEREEMVGPHGVV